jgi:molybdate transport system substrate-binding protein
VGQYSKEIFTHLGIWDKLQSMSKVTFASNVKEVLVQVASAAVSCGVVYGTDAATSNGVEVVAEAPTGSHTVVTYPAAILKTVKDEKAARAFLDFLKSDACSKVFKEIGFAIPSSR